MAASFGSKVAFAVVDKFVLSAALVMIGLLFQSRWHTEQINLERQRHDDLMTLAGAELGVAHAELAGKLIPQIVGSASDVDRRSYLLKTLLVADAIETELAAVLTGSLIRDKASDRRIIEAIRGNITKDIGPFLDEANLTLLEEEEGARSAPWSTWRNVVGHYLGQGLEPATHPIDPTDEVLGRRGRFYALANLAVCRI